MAIKTYRQSLEETQIAIESVLSGQEYEINGRRVRKADLEWLERREIRLLEKVEAGLGDTPIGSAQSTTGAYQIGFE